MSSRAVDDGQGKLTIRNVQREDEGRYTCTGSDFIYDTVSDHGHLNVEGKVKNLFVFIFALLTKLYLKTRDARALFGDTPLVLLFMVFKLV